MAELGQWIRNVFGTRGARPPDDDLPRPRAEAPGPAPFAAGNNAFALALYARLRERGRNLFFSPFSLRAALGMAYAGARGDTASELAAALRFPVLDEALHAAFEEAIGRLGAAGGGAIELAVANSLWAQEGSPMRAEFAELCARRYGGGLIGVDFRSAPDAARQRINGWTEERTRQRIHDLIPAGTLTSDTRLVLANAVYFKAPWLAPFDQTMTREQPFRRERGGRVNAPLMHAVEDWGYVRGPGFQAVDLTYTGGDLTMMVLVPDRGDGLQALEDGLTPGLFHDCRAGMEHRTVQLFLPRFRVTWGTAELSPTLGALGMRMPFVQGVADFAGINGVAPPDPEALFIARVLHRAFVETGEEGTEAAAATAVESLWVGASPGGYRPPPIPVVRADHPFLFAIVERRTGMILFLGRVADPTSES
jgi:serpin B